MLCTKFFLIQKKFASKKFDESLDLAIVLGVDVKKSDQLVRGIMSLPKMPEKKIRIAVFAEGDDAKKAKDAGADIVGSDDLLEKVKKSEIDFDKCISTPELMSKVGTLGQILGPKGLMPNPKLGTVAKDVAEAIKKVRSGQIEYKTDKILVKNILNDKFWTPNKLELKHRYLFFRKINLGKNIECVW